MTACAVWLVAHELRAVAFPDFGFAPLTSRFAHDVVLLVVAGICLWRGVAVRAERTAWLLIGCGVLGWAAGELYYSLVLWAESAPPVPSPADAGFLAFPLLTFAGMLALLRNRARFSPALVVDGIATALAVAALSAAIVFQTALQYASGDPLSVGTSLAYPIADLFLLAVGVGALAGTGWRLDRTWALLACGIGLFSFADSMYLVRVAEGTYESGGWFDAGWWGGLLLIALAAWQPRPTRPSRAVADSPRLLIAPLASGAVALELLVYGSLGDLNPLAVALAAAAAVFVMIRLTLTFRQNLAMLRASRGEALTDALTGLGNRRALTRDLDAALATAVPESPLVLALFDLDGFKHYNDTFGHPAGDQLLARLGSNLRGFLGNRGTVDRMGGDEFCALFEPRLEDRVALLEGCALALSDHGKDVWVGCSYGAISLPLEATAASDALRIADQRMYASKHAGRMSASRQLKESLLTILTAHDPDVVAHCRVVADRAEALARTLALPHTEREAVRLAAELHEVGQMYSPWASAPLGARIVAVADAYDGSAAALRAGDRFDPAVLDALETASVPFVLS